MCVFVLAFFLFLFFFVSNKQLCACHDDLVKNRVGFDEMEMEIEIEKRKLFFFLKGILRIDIQFIIEYRAHESDLDRHHYITSKQESFIHSRVTTINWSASAWRGRAFFTQEYRTQVNDDWTQASKGLWLLASAFVNTAYRADSTCLQERSLRNFLLRPATLIPGTQMNAWSRWRFKSAENQSYYHRLLAPVPA